MKLLIIAAIGSLLAITLSRADDMRWTDKVVARYHIELNACDKDAKQGGIPMFWDCSEFQTKIINYYDSYDEYQAARIAS